MFFSSPLFSFSASVNPSSILAHKLLRMRTLTWYPDGSVQDPPNSLSVTLGKSLVSLSFVVVVVVFIYNMIIWELDGIETKIWWDWALCCCTHGKLRLRLVVKHCFSTYSGLGTVTGTTEWNDEWDITHPLCIHIRCFMVYRVLSNISFY